jgi:hypothetical protein
MNMNASKRYLSGIGVVAVIVIDLLELGRGDDSGTVSAGVVRMDNGRVPAELRKAVLLRNAQARCYSRIS